MYNKTIVPLIVLYLGLALMYSFMTPVYEAPDELYHFAFINRLANGRPLPVQTNRPLGPWRQEGSQPPLYYAAAAALVAGIDRSDFSQISLLNPHSVIGDPGLIGNKNHVLHEAYPPALNSLHGAALATWVARVLSIFLGAVTVACIYHTALSVTNRNTIAVIAAGLTAFNPQFLFISAAVNNDNLVTALNSLILWQTVAMLRQERLDPRRSLLLAMLVALASLSKLSGLAMIPIVTLAGAWVGYRSRNLRGLGLLVGIMIAVWGVVAGWWYLRNLTLYGELLGTQTMMTIVDRRDPPALGALIIELGSLALSYWGLFGWFNVFALGSFYLFTHVLMLAALAGLCLYMWHIRHDHVQGARIFFLVLTFVLGFTALIFWTRQTPGTQGRLLFPYMAAISTLLAIGLTRLRLSPHWILPPLAAFAALIPFVTIMPTYRPPDPLDLLPDNVVPLDVRFKAGDVETIALIGYQTDLRRYTAGERVPLTLYWKPLAHTDRDYSLYVHAVTVADGEVVGQVNTLPGLGSLRTTHWQIGAVYPDHLTITLDATSARASALSANLGWWVPEWGTYMQPTTPEGDTLTAISFSLGGYVPAAQPITLEGFRFTEGAVFGDQFRLIGYTIHDQDIMLAWEALRTPDRDYTVFTLMLDAAYDPSAQNRVLAHGDAAPDLPTRYWRPGDRFTTIHPWRYEDDTADSAQNGVIYVGWYNPDDFSRLSFNAPDNMLRLGE